MKLWDNDPAAPVVAGLGVLVFIGVLWVIWWTYQNPCTRERTYPCTNTYCSVYVPVGDDSHLVCMVWTTEHTTCTECIERTPRSELLKRQGVEAPKEGKW